MQTSRVHCFWNALTTAQRRAVELGHSPPAGCNASKEKVINLGKKIFRTGYIHLSKTGQKNGWRSPERAYVGCSWLIWYRRIL